MTLKFFIVATLCCLFMGATAIDQPGRLTWIFPASAKDPSHQDLLLTFWKSESYKQLHKIVAKNSIKRTIISLLAAYLLRLFTPMDDKSVLVIALGLGFVLTFKTTIKTDGRILEEGQKVGLRHIKNTVIASDENGEYIEIYDE